MAYQIDFTASNYVNRSRRKVFLRLLLAAVIAGIVWGIDDAYKTYNQPTLNMRLAEFEAVARPVEEMSAAWDTAAREYDVMMRYYRLLWAANPVKFLASMSAPDGTRFGRGFRPEGWTLRTGGDCKLNYRYVFDPGDKAEQAKGLEEKIAAVVTSAVDVVDGKVDVKGVKHENLLSVNELNITVGFALPNVKAFPAKERSLTACVKSIADWRKKVQESKIAEEGDVKGAPTTAKAVMMAYLPMGKDKPEFPYFTNVINVAGWLGRADQFIARNRIPLEETKQRQLKEVWNRVGEARLPWQRFRLLDNEELVAQTKALEPVSDGVKRFKGFLDQRHVDCLKKLEPFVEAYDRGDVFNKPLIETDLRDRVAKAAGIMRARTSFKDEPKAEPAVLVKKDETFTFTWVRWNLTLGETVDDKTMAQADGETAAVEPLTLERLTDCVQKALALGPGYALDTMKVSFDADGRVAGAVLEGLLPVKKSVVTKEAAKNVH